MASPIIAGIEAHASETVKKEGPEAFYKQGLFAVTTGGQGGCHTYLCIAEPGYNGPADWGTPDGPLELATGYHAITDAATDVAPKSATLNGYVNPEGVETEYSFEYGKTTAYEDGKTTTKVGTGAFWKAASQSITGLELNTTYHYRLVASNKTSGTTYGEDRTVVTVPNPTGAKTTHIRGVSCTSSTACTASGYYENTSGVYLALTESWNGTEWKILSTTEPTGTLNSLLVEVSCTASNACTAVGWYENSSGVELPWAARWNGTAWSVQTVPSPTGAKGTSPYDVSCTSSTVCTMTGYYENSAGTWMPFAESWNGTEWSVQTVPNPTGSTRTVLEGVSCTSSSACTVSGYYENSSGTSLTLAEHWNGSEWKIQSTLNPEGAKDSSLNGGVSCTSSTACTAVGDDLNSSGKWVTLAEHWNGTEWQIQTTPNTENSELSGGVSCPSSTFCAAVGNTGKTFAEIYD